MLTKSEIFKRKKEREEEFHNEKSKLMKTENYKLGKDVKIHKGDHIQPRHLVTDCPMFRECPADGKCRSFDLGSPDCKECILVKQGDICFKRMEMHSPDNLARLYGANREVIDLDN